MNKKATLPKKAILGIVLCVCVIATILIVVLLSGRKTGYRDILVFEAATDATVLRDGGSIAVYEGMKLQSGDDIVVTGDGCLRLLLDEDKYVTLVSGTEILLTASGDSADSNTEIQLVTGSILNEIDNKLSPASTYEITTPASVMAVRGTAFYVSSTIDETGMYTVDLAVLDGSVGTKASGDNTEVFVKAGESAQLYGNETESGIIFASQPIDYSALPADILEIVIERKENGDWASLPASAGDLKTVLALSDLDNALADNNIEGTETVAETENDTKKPETTTDDTAAKVSETTSGAETKTSETSGTKKPPVKNTTASQASTETTAASETPTPSSGNDVPYTPPVNTEPTAPTDSDSDIPFGGNQTPNENLDPTMPQSFTVTFITADGSIFAKQRITNGSLATCPTLVPTTGGAWYLGDTVYDFNTPVTADITLCFK